MTKCHVYFAFAQIVSPAAFEPLPGWVDNLNGPTGLMIGCGKGVIRSVLINQDNVSEVIPVDYAINGLIVIPFEFVQNKERYVGVQLFFKPKRKPLHMLFSIDPLKFQFIILPMLIIAKCHGE